MTVCLRCREKNKKKKKAHKHTPTYTYIYIYICDEFMEHIQSRNNKEYMPVYRCLYITYIYIYNNNDNDNNNDDVIKTRL